MAWDEEKKAKAVKLYLAGEPTPANSAELLKEISEALGESPNGVRMVLSKAGAYVKVAAGSSSSTKESADGSEKKPAKASKEGSQAKLKALLEEGKFPVDEDIISKLTGKAAVYFSSILEKVV